ncbi:MAG TPA: glycosyltransferase family 2 protein [archaeon]|nr:glycosyltransferase family 2 protein [archaeon]
MITYVIPAYNEEENLRRIGSELIPALNASGEKYEIIIVNDGSSDSTEIEAKKLVDRFKFVRLISHKKNSGMGAAVRTGISSASGDILITLDSDLTYGPSEILKVLNEYKKTKADCVIGSHFMEGGNVEEVKDVRKLLSQAINHIYRMLFGGNVKTISSILRLYKTEQLRELNLTSAGFTINAEILFKLLQRKRRVVETPVTLTTRKFGISKLNFWKEAKNHIVLLTKVIVWKLFPKAT